MQEKTVHTSSSTPFYVKDCALSPIATGIKARTLPEFRDGIKAVSAESIFYHLLRQYMETSLIPGHFYNDFSYWAHYQLHDDVLAERLALIAHSSYADFEKLRLDVLEVIENRIDEEDGNSSFSIAKEPFHFVKSKIVIFNSPYRMQQPKDLVTTLPLLPRSSIFYHFIDARRRQNTKMDDFSCWLQQYPDDAPLIGRLKQIDPYFISLADLQQKLILEVTDYFLKEEGGENE